MKLKKNGKKILIDIGSSTIKVYISDGERCVLDMTKSIAFKEGFDPEKGIEEKKKKELIDLLLQVKKKSNGTPIKAYATALYRKLNPKTKNNLLDEIHQKTGVYFNVIDQNLENHYLEKAMISKCDLKEPILLINIGGGSTELVVIKNKVGVCRENIDLGVGQINTKYIDINSGVSGISLESVVSYVKTLLPKLPEKPVYAFYTGGELTFMKRADYPLHKNNLFLDLDHPYKISTSDFAKSNKKLFRVITLTQLEKIMPENPTWMHGARGCSAIAQAICEKYEIKEIIPSDSNLINGVMRGEHRSVTISGSFRKHLDYILGVRKQIIQTGAKVLSPRFSEPKNPGDEFVIFGGEEGFSPLELERYHLKSIENSDALIVCSPQGYVGASALIEIGYAHALGKRIIFTEKPEEFMLNTLPSEIGL